ncbi:DUF2911 domain-containing protein [Daejeonella oryzae]|uniref:DUF2911 domain-containing protein n=1 Tax=Daejeonella oryzae TaxID=1122943 RepID=UPI00047E8B10|nr:DUF2911 domain-containing protein [Daejeonella oryzae]
MKISTLKIFIMVLLTSASAITLKAQTINTPPASPTQTIKQQFALSEIELTYSRPGAKGRKIMGELVPYNEVWRTGANASTKIKFGEDVKIAGNNVPKGEYALYTIPGKEEWTIILSKNTTLWGSMGYKESEDLVRFKAKAMNSPMNMETFTMQFVNLKAQSMDVHMMWENTMVNFTVTADIDSKISKQITDAMSDTDRRPYYAAASYYFENDKDINSAYKWVKKAVEMNPTQYWVEHLKAKIELKMGDKKAAILSATSSMAKAKAQNNPDYIALNEKLIAEAKK